MFRSSVYLFRDLYLSGARSSNFTRFFLGGDLRFREKGLEEIDDVS